ncbi:MAG: hypothetical protein NkDv07_0666 [Candidatus Improbicoccus devescovinae]|nr:MAG: hypothetical protein NkDv07_0666 [Candidatus Improbicoccus devescovinae]
MKNEHKGVLYLEKYVELVIKNLKSKLLENNFISSEISEQNNEGSFDIKISSIPQDSEISKTCFFVLKYESYKVNLSLKDSDNILSSWLLDQNSDAKFIEFIVNDFLEIILKSVDIKTPDTHKIKKKSKSETINYYNFLDKICEIFPEIKPEFYNETSSYGENFRVVHFVKNFLVPNINKLCASNKNGNLEKISKYLCNSYINGDETVKSLVTMGIFNSIVGEKQRNSLYVSLPAAMKKVFMASWRQK